MTLVKKTTRPVKEQRVKQMDEDAARKLFFSFLDTVSTATNRATFYNTKQEQENAVSAIHQDLFKVDRGLYSLALLLPGATDYSIQIGMKYLLSNSFDTVNACILSSEQEQKVIGRLIDKLPPQRALKLFLALSKARVNNSRLRKLILRYILCSRNLELWTIRYRSKLKQALQHAWGKRMTSILRMILAKAEKTAKETKIVQAHILKYASTKTEKVLECVGFILGSKRKYQLPLLKAFGDAKVDLEKGGILPYEVLEGIRSCYHTNRTNAEVLELTKKKLTNSQKMTIQRKAEKSTVQVEMDVRRYDAVRLYLYAYERGMTASIMQALVSKAKHAASQLPVSFDRVGILIDNSASMFGNTTQQLRPMAISLATRDMLVAASKYAFVEYSSATSQQVLPQPEGGTALADALVNLLEKDLDTIFILSDGYENSPAGRVAEVIRLAKQIGVRTSIVHLSPVMAAEAGGLRNLSLQIPTMPINKPEAMGMNMLRAAFETDFWKGVEA
ncbi:MAG: VWA domain-containing protein, partial [Saprospiraceae bacterium]|nr:VWA domain-containing protein [Saprospiraceae bacterium]